MHPALPTPQRTAGWVLLLAALLLAGPAAAEPLDIDQDHIGPRWLGTNYQDNLGWLVASSGDLNGDGLGDFAVTSPQDEGPVTFDSVVRLFFGRSSGAPGSGQADWANVEIRDGKVGTDAIFQLAFVPDVNGDGNPDIAVALPNAGTAGKALVLPGGGTAWPVQITSSDSLITWTGYTQTENSDLSAETRPSDITGGDFDDDGLGDVVISSGLFQRVWVHYGVDGLGEYSLESLSTHFEECFEEAPGSNFGSAMASGDFNNDGYDDLAIGGPGCDGGNGQVFVRYGSAAGLSATPDLTLSDGDRLGGALIAGDLNADGTSDLLVQELLSGSNQDRGNLRLYLGGSSGLETTASQAIVGGFSDKRFGATAAILPDVSSPPDGLPELVVGSPEAAFDGLGQGAVYVFMSPAASGAEISTNDAKYRITGSHQQAWFGASVATVMDFDGNGHPEVAIGEPNYTEGETENDYHRGRLYLLTALPDRDEDGDGVSTLNGDCDDTNDEVSPTDVEVCDGIDNNCDHVVDEGCDEGDDDDSAVSGGDDDDSQDGENGSNGGGRGCGCGLAWGASLGKGALGTLLFGLAFSGVRRRRARNQRPLRRE